MRSDEETIREEKLPKNEYTVEEAMRELNLCRKSIYNYINRGVLSASKVNGRWAIQEESVRRIPRKDRKKSEDSKDEASVDRFLVDREPYEELLKQVGKLRAMEELVWEYKRANEELKKRVWDLEQELERYRKKGFWKRHFGAKEKGQGR